MTIENLIAQLGALLTASDIVLLKMGDAVITIGSLLKLVLLVSALFWFAGTMRRWLVTRLLGRFDTDEGTRIAIASMVRYLVLVLGMVLILQNMGINLSALGVVAGAIGVGVGFGLQNIVSNFISGVIVMLERPIKVGDRIEVGAVEGVVRDISARRTTVVTADNIAVLIPNQRFIVENVINMVYLEEPVRLRIAVSLAGDTDLAALERLWLQVAQAHDQVLATPQPKALLRSIGNVWKVELTAWFRPHAVSRGSLSSELNFALAQAFAAHGIRYA